MFYANKLVMAAFLAGLALSPEAALAEDAYHPENLRPVLSDVARRIQKAWLAPETNSAVPQSLVLANQATITFKLARDGSIFDIKGLRGGCSDPFIMSCTEAVSKAASVRPLPDGCGDDIVLCERFYRPIKAKGTDASNGYVFTALEVYDRRYPDKINTGAFSTIVNHIVVATIGLPQVPGPITVKVNCRIDGEGTMSDIKVSGPAGSEVICAQCQKLLASEVGVMPPLPFGVDGPVCLELAVKLH